MDHEAPRPIRDMVRRVGKRHAGRGLPPRNYERVVVAGRPIDERTAPARLFRAIEDSLHRELGGRDSLAAGQLALARRAASLVVQAEVIERQVLEGGDPDLAGYRATCAELRRCLEALGPSVTRTPDAPTPGACATVGISEVPPIRTAGARLACCGAGRAHGPSNAQSAATDGHPSAAEAPDSNQQAAS